MRLRCSFFTLVLIGSFVSTAPARGALEATQVVSGLDEPLFAAAPPGDGRLFVVERSGRIRIADPATGAIASPDFLDITGRVGTGGEGGLLGLAFPADHASSGVFYVNYTDGSGDSVISRFGLLAADEADAASEEVILTVAQDFSNHNGGTIAFGPLDGMLYVGLGDGGSGNDPLNRAQDPQSLLGKMLRVDVATPGPGYAVPADNPFVGARDPGDAVLDEIWSLGWRNPFRWGFDRVTGELWVADVGQGAREELDREPAYDPGDPSQAPGQPGYPGGRNYGWRVMEGTLCNIASDPTPCGDPGFTDPVHQYAHSAGRCSITGGPAYRGSAPEVAGHVFFGDWCTGEVWTLDPSDEMVTPRTTELAGAAGTGFQLVAFAEDGLGELYIVLSGGTIHRIDGSSALDKSQQACVREMNRRGAMVARQQNSDFFRCVKSTVRGKTEFLGTPADPQSCLTNDVKGKVDKQAQKLLAREAQRCLASPEQLPDFAYTGGATVLDAARGVGSEPVALAADLFGPDLGAALVPIATDRDAARCQMEASRRAGKLFDALFKSVNRIKKDALAGRDGPAVGSTEALALAALGYLETDPRGRVANATAKLSEKVVDRCTGVAISSAFPGGCAGASDAGALASCVARASRCRFCRAFDRFDATLLGCDDFDDGLANASCP